MTKAELDGIKNKMKIGKKVEKLGYAETIRQSDKLGFDWKVTTISGIEVVKEYVAQDVPCGTMENPIVWTDGTELINSAFYLVDDKLYVWMGEWVEW